MGALDERGEGTKKHKLVVTKESQGSQSVIGNIVDNIVITAYVWGQLGTGNTEGNTM